MGDAFLAEKIYQFTKDVLMAHKLLSQLLLCLFLVSSCSTASNMSKNRYGGIYQNPQNPLERYVIDYRDELYYVKYYAPDQQEWEGVGYESQGYIIAVAQAAQASDEEAEGRFLKISFPGEDRLFVVTRNVEGGYLDDGYFQRNR